MTATSQSLASTRSDAHFGGVDLLRGIAMFAVVILHTDEGIVQVPPTWQWITTVSGFAVPFFLATSLYFATKSLYREGQFIWKVRLSRLLIPYIAWSSLYLVYRSAKYWISDQPDKVVGQFQDPLALIFLGGATLHLYFLPLLLTGLMLLGCICPLVIRAQLPLYGLIGLTVVSWLGYELLIQSGNDFQHVSNTAFQALLGNSPVASNSIIRLFSVGLAWGLRCLPYLCLGLILAKISGKVWSHSKLRSFTIVTGTSIILFGHLVLPPALHELLRGYGALLVALSISSPTLSSPVIRQIGNCAFGIYLIHLLFVEIFQTLLKRIYPAFTNQASTEALLLLSLLIFLLSWITVFSLRQQTSLSRLKLL